MREKKSIQGLDVELVELISLYGTCARKKNSSLT